MPFNFEEAAALQLLRDDQGIDRPPEVRVEALVHAVNATHAGLPVAEVDAELRRRFAEHGFTPVEAAFAEVVRSISQSELPD
jgi:hypothetical protein